MTRATTPPARDGLGVTRVVEESADHGLVGKLLGSLGQLGAEAVRQDLVRLGFVGPLIDGHETRRVDCASGPLPLRLRSRPER